MRLNRKHSAGFGLVEVMVAMLIGMFGVMVMMQVLSVSEEQKRSTMGGNDAMNEGVMALYALQSEVRMSGYGISDIRLLGCGLTLPSGAILDDLAPVIINSPKITGADANTDTLLIFYGNGNGSPQGDLVFATGNKLQTPSMFVPNDWVIDAPATRPLTSPFCQITLQRVSNVAGQVVTLLSAANLGNQDTLFNIGQSYRAVGYAVRGGNLTMCDFTATTCTAPTNWSSIANNIVSLRAQYGRDTATAGFMDGIVDLYDQTTPVQTLTVPNPSCLWAKISAVRLAIVSRSVQSEKTPVTTIAPVWDGSVANNPAGSAASPINLSGDANWQYHRYKVFQTVVPIRNHSWMGVVPTC